MCASTLEAIERWLGEDWRDLAAEFRAAPLGPHGPALQWLLVLLRSAKHCLDLVLVQTGPGRWALAERRASGPPRLIDSGDFESLEAAELEAFRRRWRKLTGTEPFAAEDIPA